MQAWRRVLPQHAPALTQTALAGQSRSPSHSSTVGQCTRRKSTHFLSPPTVRAQAQKSLRHRLMRQNLLLTAGLPLQLPSVLLVSSAPASSTPTPQPNRAASALPAMSPSAWRRVGPTVRALVISSKRYPPDASSRVEAQRFLSFTSIESPFSRYWCFCYNKQLSTTRADGASSLCFGAQRPNGAGSRAEEQR